MEKCLDRLTVGQLATALGGDARGCQVLCPGPGHGIKDRSLSVLMSTDAPGGFVVWSFANDDPISCRDHVRARLGLDPWGKSASRLRAGSPLRIVISAAADLDRAQRARSAAAKRIWYECCDPRGTLVERYLASRFLELDAEVAQAIRFHSCLAYDGKRLPAMVALLRDIKTDEPCGVHRTWLDTRGNKVARRMLGRAKGAAVKLDEDARVTNSLTVGEGVETSLTARQFGCGPVWALGSVAGVEAFPILEGIEVLNVLAECDDSGASSRAIEVTAERWLNAGRDCFVYMPPTGDINDALISYQRQQPAEGKGE